jgi:hypothetical protein
MGDPAALREAWSHLSGSTVAKLTAINELTTVSKKPIDLPVTAIVDYLGDKREQLANFAGMIVTQNLRARLQMDPASSAVLAASHLLLLLDGHDGPVLRTAQSNVLTIFQNLLDAIVADSSSGLTAADKDGLLGLVYPRAPLFSPPISVFDLVDAKLA